MKCINCQTHNNLKNRTANSGRCLRCNHQFAFEPTAMTGVKITDPMFAKAIADISVNDTLFFTPKQLFYLLDKRSRPEIYEVFYAIPGYLIINIASAIFAFIWTLAQFSEWSIAFIFVMFVINCLLIAGTFTASRSSNYPYQKRQKLANSLQVWGGIVLVCGIGVTLLSSSLPLFLASSAIGMLSIYLGTRQIEKKP